MDYITGIINEATGKTKEVVEDIAEPAVDKKSVE